MDHLTLHLFTLALLLFNIGYAFMARNRNVRVFCSLGWLVALIFWLHTIIHVHF